MMLMKLFVAFRKLQVCGKNHLFAADANGRTRTRAISPPRWNGSQIPMGRQRHGGAPRLNPQRGPGSNRAGEAAKVELQGQFGHRHTRTIPKKTRLQFPVHSSQVFNRKPITGNR